MVLEAAVVQGVLVTEVQAEVAPEVLGIEVVVEAVALEVLDTEVQEAALEVLVIEVLEAVLEALVLEEAYVLLAADHLLAVDHHLAVEAEEDNRTKQFKNIY